MSIILSLPKKPVNSEKGAVLALVAILMFVLIGFFALAIDLNMQAASLEQTNHFSRFGVLKAIAEFNNAQWCNEGEITTISDPDRQPCTNCERYNIALSGVNELLDANRVVGDKNVVPELVPSRSAAACQGNQSSLSSSNPNIAKLIPGTLSNNQADCDQHEQEPPCFVPLAQLNNTGPRPSAFKVEGELYRGVSRKFAQAVFGAKDYDLRAQAVATMVPRHGCFIVDVSSSTDNETHTRLSASYDEYRGWINSGYDADGGMQDEAPDPYIHAHPDDWGNNFSYYLTCPPANNNAGSGFQNCYAHPPGLTGDINAAAQWGNDDRTWQFLNHANLHPTRPPAAADSSVQHYGDDYVFKRTYGDSHYNSVLHDLHPNPDPNQPNGDANFTAESGGWYNLDLGFLNHNIPSYKGPEPLTSIIAGIRTAMLRFRDRQVAGDQACVVFYDRSVTWPRMFKITDRFNDVAAALNFSDLDSSGIPINARPIGSDDPNVIEQTLASENAQGILKSIRHGLFPRGSYHGFTNTIVALTAAYSELAAAAADNPIPTSDFVAMLSDGLANCPTCQFPTSNSCSSEITSGCSSGNLPGTCIQDCKNDYDNYRRSINDLNAIVASNPNIPIHSILVGYAAGPHTLDIPDPDNPGQCLTDKQYREQGIGEGEFPVSGNSPATVATWRNRFLNANVLPFYQTNVHWYRISWFTRGLWLPIRTRFLGVNPCQLAPLDENGVPCDPTHFLPSGQRRVRDPFCRSQEQQIKDAVDEILGDNPFRLVDPQS